ncbi:hypothetical protein [Paucimonas lemoignei]|uniref:hypothetical protein n=1 Tax=Paucimonas lemoignei TaxID=29443 RepID=UPI00104EAE85|nr:hypothetical protein [Paucimonas lemoignei]
MDNMASPVRKNTLTYCGSFSRLPPIRQSLRNFLGIHVLIRLKKPSATAFFALDTARPRLQIPVRHTASMCVGPADQLNSK